MSHACSVGSTSLLALPAATAAAGTVGMETGRHIISGGDGCGCCDGWRCGRLTWAANAPRAVGIPHLGAAALMSGLLIERCQLLSQLEQLGLFLPSP
jgi:hypothetical protein